MEKGFYWVTYQGEITIGRYHWGHWYILGYDPNFDVDERQLVVGPRVKGQEECQSDD